MCVFAFGGHVFCPFATEIGTHTRHAQGKVCVKNLKNYAPGPLSRGRSPRKILLMTQTLHIPVHSNTRPHQSCVDLCIAVLSKASSDRISLADETYSSIACVSLQIQIAFAPNPTYTFSAASATREVCRFLSKQARTARFEFIQHIRDLSTKIARDVSTDLSLHYSILPVRRTGHVY